MKQICFLITFLAASLLSFAQVPSLKGTWENVNREMGMEGVVAYEFNGDTEGPVHARTTVSMDINSATSRRRFRRPVPVDIGSGGQCAFSFNFGDGVTVLSYSEEGIDFSEERAVGYFDSFSSYGPFNVHYVQSEPRKVLVEGKEEFVKKVKTVVSDEELSIKFEKGKYEHLVLRVTVYSPNIEDIATSGSGGVRGSGSISVDGKCRRVEASTLGSGSINGKVGYSEIERNSLGSGKVRL